jgi:hypothetical protein
MIMPPSQNNFWKSKLAAYLHDPPSKCLDLRLHEQSAKTLYRQAGFHDEDELRKLSDTYAKQSDWAASAADRFPFPKSRGNLSSVFDGVRAKFHHPLSSDQAFPFHAEFASAEAAMEVDGTLQPHAENIDAWPDTEQWRARFFCHWRLWEQFCTEKDYRFAFLPADTRIPDHSVWTHMQVVSALDGCAVGTGGHATLRPAFLKFQLGPVKDFIAEARSVRDLWSGSYLLSWLMASGLKALAMEAGPDSVIYPNLKGQPLLDLHLRDGLWSQINVNGKPVWEHLSHDQHALLTPSLPNIFLAIVHEDRAKDLGNLVERAIREEWARISDSVWQFCEQFGIIRQEAGFSPEQRKERFYAQTAKFLTLSWQATPWPKSLDAAVNLAESFDDNMPIREAAKRLEAVIEYATKTMPEADRDPRYYSTDGKKLNNIGLGWSVILAFNGWQLDAVRQTRNFDAWGDGAWSSGTFANKDSLGGKAEAVAGGREWAANAKSLGGVWKSLFKHDDWLGAATLIKRSWHIAYLKDVWGLKTGSTEFRMPNTHKIASHRPYESGDDDDDTRLPGEKYFAVLSLDGDEIGKWVSGEKTPALGEQFSNYTDAQGTQRQGAKKYFEDHDGAKLLSCPRPLSPGYHLQFSQALSNFASICVRRIVEAHDGRLIYAGGDDVLAMLPADTAMACAQALRNAFQGRPVEKAGISSPAPGFLSISKDQTGHAIGFPVPGKSAEVSAGIAIAHFKSPLQDVVRAAQQAEKRAKRQLGRAAVAITLLKRSGEIAEWGAKWNSGGLALYEAIASMMRSESVAAKFPHRICQLLEPYRNHSECGVSIGDAADFDAASIIRQEFSFAISRQSSPGKMTSNSASLDPLLDAYLSSLSKEIRSNTTQAMLNAIDGLCTIVAFAHRTSNPKADRQNS